MLPSTATGSVGALVSSRYTPGWAEEDVVAVAVEGGPIVDGGPLPARRSGRSYLVVCFWASAPSRQCSMCGGRAVVAPLRIGGLLRLCRRWRWRCCGLARVGRQRSPTQGLVGGRAGRGLCCVLGRSIAVCGSELRQRRLRKRDRCRRYASASRKKYRS